MTEPEAPLSRRQSKNRGHRRRVAARERVASRATRTGCPRPDKAAYDPADPTEARMMQAALGPGQHSYSCRCGFSHNGNPNE